MFLWWSPLPTVRQAERWPLAADGGALHCPHLIGALPQAWVFWTGEGRRCTMARIGRLLA